MAVSSLVRISLSAVRISGSPCMSSPWAGGGSRPILLAGRELVEPTPNLVDFDNDSQYPWRSSRRSLLLVCHCHRICDRTIRESIREGARSIAEIGASCRAGTGCGGCRPAIAGLLRDQSALARPSLTVLQPLTFRLAS